MTIIIQHRCHACGAPSQGVREPWVRCPFCETLLAYDMSAWFESEAYAAYLRDAPAQAQRWEAYQRWADEASRAGRDGDLVGYRKNMRAACELMLELTPHTCPPEANRERHLDWQVWWREQQDLDPGIADLSARVQAVFAAIDYADPLPTLERAMELSRQIYDAGARRPDLPPDPDGLPPPARQRITLAMVASAYYSMLEPRARVEVLERIYGAGNVQVVDGPGDEMALFAPWTCPRCGLVSLQARTQLQLTCAGCFHQRPRAKSLDRLEPLQTRCSECGAEVTLPAGAQDHRCPYCAAVVWRMVRSWQAERDLSLEIMRQHGGGPGQGQEGLPLSEANHRQLVLEGLARQACWYWRFLSPGRFAAMVRTSLPDEPLEAALKATLQAARQEGCDRQGLELVCAAQAELDG